VLIMTSAFNSGIVNLIPHGSSCLPSSTTVEPASYVDIAKRSTKRTHSIADSDVRYANIRQCHLILQRSIPRRRLVQERERPGNNVGPLRQILILPDPPHAINHCVVQEEIRIGRGVVEVSPRVAAHGVVSA
jgi:hypothetical protein